MMNEKVRPMRKVIVFTNLTLDGVMQAPGRPDEDMRGGFPYGGWGVPYAAMSMAGGILPETGPMLMGRKTYEDFYAVWPKQSDNPYTERLNQAQKYVASTTLKEPLAWINASLLKGDVAEAVARLKAQPGKDFLIMGSGVLVQTLMQHNLVDLYVLLIHPLVVGCGRRLFSEGSLFTALQLVDSKTTPNGVVIASYRPAETENL
jgi:dihydrofolate reductase